jgi:transcriptional regulator with XRE-family HTH domain
MNLSDKMKAWMQAKGLKQEGVESLTGVPQSKVSEMLRKETNNFRYIRLIQSAMSRDWPGATLDWLSDPTTNWPPPEHEPNAVILTEGERWVLNLAHEVSEGDPELRPARRRLTNSPTVMPSGPIMPPPGHGAADVDSQKGGGKGKPRRGHTPT